MNAEFLREQWTRARTLTERARPHVARAVAETRAGCATLAAELRRRCAQTADSPQWKSLIAHGRSLVNRARPVVASPRTRPALFAVGGVLLLGMLLLSGRGATDRQRHHAAAPKAFRAEIDAGLARAERESLAAIEQANAEVAAYLGTCRQNSRALAGWMLGGWGKASYALGRADQAWTFVKQMARTGTVPASNSLPDRFGAEVRQKYAEMVINPTITRSVVAQALSSYAARLRQIEANLVVELGADIADEALGGETMPPFDATPLVSDLDAALTGAMQTAEADFFVGIVRDYVTNRIGDAITDQVGADNWNFLANITADCLVGEKVDRLAGVGLTYAGYDPEAKATAAVEHSVDQLTQTTLSRLRSALTEAHTRRCARRAELLHAALEGR